MSQRLLARRPPRRVLLLLVLGVLLVAGRPAAASVTAAGGAAPAVREQRALDLLLAGAEAARTRSWSGTQYVAAWRGGSLRSRTVALRHEPGSGTRIELDGEGSATVPSVALDAQLLDQLADRYVLSVAGTETCSGRRAQVVEARRPGGRVAGRFWLDRATNLPLRSEVWDRHGRQLRSSAFLDLEIGAAAAVPVTAPGAPLPGPVEVDGWTAPRALPGGYRLFDVGQARRGGAEVVHLAYSDGLSTISVFSQPGTLGSAPGEGFRRERVGGSAVWVQDGMPERVVWSGAGQVFTMIADAGHGDLRSAVGTLPHDRAAPDGPTARIARGLARVGSWLNPLA